MESAGYNIITLKYIFFACSMCLMQDFFLVSLFSISTAFQDYYNISPAVFSLIMNFVWVGFAAGSSTTGFILKILNRRQVILISLFILIICNILICVIHNIFSFALFKVIGSIFLGYYMTLSTTLLSEYLPVKFRGFFLTSIWAFCDLGAVYFLLFCKIYLPELNYNHLEKNIPQDINMAFFSIFYASVPIFFCLLFFLKDSPRNLLMLNKKEEAGEILEFYVNIKLTEEELKAVHKNLINFGENNHTKKNSDYKLLFSRRYLKFIIILMLTNFLYSFTTYGIGASLPIILKRQNTYSVREKEEKNEINSLITYYLIIMPFAGMILSELKFIGRKYSVIILSSISTLFAIIFLISFENIYIMIFLCGSFINNSWNIHKTWVTEIIPSKIRDTGFGVFMATSRFGCVIAMFTFIPLANYSTVATIWVFIISLVLNLILIIFHPKNEIEELDTKLDLSHSTDSNNSVSLENLEISKEIELPENDERKFFD